MTPCLQHKPKQLYSSVEVVSLRNTSLKSVTMAAIFPDKCCGPPAMVDDRKKHLYGLNALLELGFCFLQLLVVSDVGRLCRWTWLRRLGHVGTRLKVDVFKLSRSCKAEITSGVMTVDEIRKTHCNCTRGNSSTALLPGGVDGPRSLSAHLSATADSIKLRCH